MTPYYDEDGITIYHGDCLEHLDVWAGLAEPAVMVTDPPYGIGWSTHGISRTSHPDRVARDYNGSSAATVTIANDTTTEVRDAALHAWAGRPALVFGSLKVSPPDACRHVAVYVKPKDAGSLSGLATMRRDVEAIYVLGDSDEWKRRPSEGPSRSTLHGDARPLSIWRTSVFKTRWAVVGTPHGLAAKSGHPHAKPTDVLSELIGLHSGVVVDPFMGSGSTLVAAKELGRTAIGFEIEEQYCARAVERLAQGVLDLRTPEGA